MNPNTMFIGTIYGTTPRQQRMIQVPIPSAGMDAGAVSHSESLLFENGFGDVVAAPGSHRRYDMVWGAREATGAQGLDAIKRLSQGAFGNGVVYFADPYNYDTNLFPPNWADPSLIRSGWPNIYHTTPTFNPVSVVSYDHPQNTVTWNVDADGGTQDHRHLCTIPVHPDYTLWVGFSGSSTGGAAIFARRVQAGAPILGTGTPLSLLPDNLPTRMNTAFVGKSTAPNVEDAVQFYIGTTGTPGTLTLAGGMAQLWRTGSTINLDGNFQPGQGNMGVKFESAALEENYIMADINGRRHLKGMSATLVEVGNSRRYANVG